MRSFRHLRKKGGVELSQIEELNLFPAKMRVLSGSVLKLIAIVAMLIDHLAVCFLIGAELSVFSLGNKTVTLYMLLRYVGRIAFPLFVFLLVEGFLHTKNRKKYGISLAIFAVASEVPFDLFCSGSPIYGRQNVFFTLLLGYLALCAIEAYHKKWAALAVLSLFVVSFFLKADYGYAGFVFIVLLYALRKMPLVGAMASACTLSIASAAAFIPIGLYSGERGFIRSRSFKYLFYVFYPLHLLVLALIKIIL